METKFEIDQTCDGEKYVVLINTTGEPDEWNDLTKPFDTYEQALEWAEHIKDNYGVYAPVPF